MGQSLFLTGWTIKNRERNWDWESFGNGHIPAGSWMVQMYLQFYGGVRPFSLTSSILPNTNGIRAVRLRLRKMWVWCLLQAGISDGMWTEDTGIWPIWVFGKRVWQENKYRKSTRKQNIWKIQTHSSFALWEVGWIEIMKRSPWQSLKDFWR